MSMTGLVDSYKWLVPGVEPDGLTYPLLTTAQYTQIHQDAGETEDASLGMLTIRSYGADYQVIPDTHVSIDVTTAAGPFYYAANGDLEAGATSSSGGRARYLGVPPGDVEVTVQTAEGLNCRANGFSARGPKTFTVYANADNYVRFLCD
jgi:hypothetical protein